MSNEFIPWRTTHGNVCPICGHDKPCGYIRYDDSDAVYLYCHRYLESGPGHCSMSGDVAYTRMGEFHFVKEQTSGTIVNYGIFLDEEHWQKFHQKDAAGRSRTRAMMPHPVFQPGKRPGEGSDTVEAASPAVHDRIYRKMLSMLVLEEDDYQALHGKDGWSDELMKLITADYPIRSMPPRDRVRFDKASGHYQEFYPMQNPSQKKLIEALQEGEDLSHIRGFYQRDVFVYENGQRTDRKESRIMMGGNFGYILPVMNIDGQIYGLRIRTSDLSRRLTGEGHYERRLEEQEKEGVKLSDAEKQELHAACLKEPGKYVYFSSANIPHGVRSGAMVGWHGLARLMPYYRQGAISRVILMEGEKKAEVAQAYMGMICISLPGVGMYRLLEEKMPVETDSAFSGMNVYEALHAMGVTKITVANDTDMATNQNVARFTKATLDAIRAHGFTPQMVQWSETLGKGIDDALIAGARPQIRTVR